MGGYGTLRPSWGDIFPGVRKKEQLNQIERELEAETRRQKFLDKNETFVAGTVSAPIDGTVIYDSSTVSLYVPETGFVGLFIECDVETLTNTGKRGYVGIYDTVEFPTQGYRVISVPSQRNWARYVSSSGYESGKAFPFGGFVVFQASEGTHHYGLTYKTQTDGTVGFAENPARFRNRRLIAMVA